MIEKRVKFRYWYILVAIFVLIPLVTLTMLVSSDLKSEELTPDYVSDEIINDSQPVINETTKVINPYIDQSVTIGKKYYEAWTDKNGIARFKITSPPGKYKVKVIYDDASVTKTLEVKNTLKLANGKKIAAKTNTKGVAKVTFKKSVLKKLRVGKKVTYQATYVKETVKKSVIVKR